MTTDNIRNKEVRLLYRVTSTGRNSFTVGASDNTKATVYSIDHGIGREFNRRSHSCEANKSYELRVQVRGKHGRCFINGQPMFDYEDEEHLQGCVGLCTHNTTAIFHNILVTDPSGKILFNGLPNLPRAVADQWFPPSKSKPPPASEVNCLIGHRAPVSEVAYSADGRHIVSVSNGRDLG